MDPERWRELDGLLQEAMEHEPDAREEWLARRCDGDAALLEETRALLELEQRSREFLETPALVRDPERIADHRIVRRLATGGSAVVYEALRDGDDEPVALKVLRGNLFVDERRLRQFRREVRTLARLRHPSIARILEARSTDDGQQFFTMELVRGRQLNRYVEEQAPALEERLWLFRELCDAIHHAHQCGVIHRDVKPANIMVDEAGRAKILDFGLARLIETDPSLASSVRDLGEVMGTLPYMSPEQAGGRSAEVDARADVYSLGVVLYELTTGDLPFDIAGLMPHEVLHLVCNQAPVRPSVRRRELRGPLETILLRAMQKDPDRRYRTAAELGADVGRFLEGRPIVARPPHPVQRLRATVASHKLAATALAGVLLGLSVFSATAWVKNRELQAKHALVVSAEKEASTEAARATAEAARAGDEADRARAVLDFLNGMLSSAHPDGDGGRDVTVRQVLDDVAQGVDAEFAERPRVLAEIHRTLGLAYLSHGRDVEAARHLGAFLEVSGELDPGPSTRRAAIHKLRAEALANRGDYEAALDELEASLGQHRALGRDDASTAPVLFASGAILFELGRTAEATSRIAAARALTPSDGADLDDASLDTLVLAADIRNKQGDRAAAEELYREALAHQLAGEGEEHTRATRILAALGVLCAEQERFDEATELLERALAAQSALLGRAHADTMATRNNLATLLVQRGQWRRAEPILVDLLAGWREIGLAEHEDYAITLSSLGATYAHLERFEESERAFRQALEVFRGTSSGRRDVLSNHVANHARALISLGRLEEAEELAYEALDLRCEVFGERSPAAAGAMLVLAEIQQENGDLDGAESAMRDALDIWRATLAPVHSDLAEGTNWLAALLHAKGELAEAEDLYRVSLDQCLSIYGEAHPRTVLRLANLGELLIEGGEPVEAEALLRRALTAIEETGEGSGPRATALRQSIAAAQIDAALRHPSPESQVREASVTGGDR